MTADTARFQDLGLAPAVLAALEAVGYETPSPIQARIIPVMLAGRDVLGQAQTGTGKTAAFALPVLSQLDLALRTPQVLVLTPTRELAIQVAEAFQRYATGIPGFHVLPIYGGSDYRAQFQQLKRGVHVVVGTPGRVMDHLERRTLDLSALTTLVLDEADEMLRMGFIEAVEWILERTPPTRRVALFSATLPPPIKRIAERYLRDPVEVSIKVRTTTAETITQRYCVVHGPHKLDALTRILDAEPTDGVIVFVRTKTATVELAERLEARGYAAAALSGDVPQKLREQTVAKLKSGALDILVATDVAARGLDVERISHVINFDIPTDTESYVHRIGRTGRAGRSGQAILFVAPRERRLLGLIERATRQRIAEMAVPSAEAVADARLARFHQEITDRLNAGVDDARRVIERYLATHDAEPIDVAAALAAMLQGETKPAETFDPAPPRRDDRESPTARGPRAERAPSVRRTAETEPPPREGMERYRIEVGFAHGAKPGNILGAIANEAGLDGKDIGRITLFDDYSTVDLPEGMPADLFQHLKKVRVAGRPLNLSRQSSGPGEGDSAPPVAPTAPVRAAPHAKAKAPSPHHKRGARPHPSKSKPRR